MRIFSQVFPRVTERRRIQGSRQLTARAGPLLGSTARRRRRGCSCGIGVETHPPRSPRRRGHRGRVGLRRPTRQPASETRSLERNSGYRRLASGVLSGRGPAPVHPRRAHLVSGLQIYSRLGADHPGVTISTNSPSLPARPLHSTRRGTQEPDGFSPHPHDRRPPRGNQGKREEA
jgi:hypothetical protein